jgi:hypothetical protein
MIDVVPALEEVKESQRHQIMRSQQPNHRPQVKRLLLLHRILLMSLKLIFAGRSNNISSR